jgi:hypothetical protein
MNLKELDSFKISDAITFHDKLNPKLWNGTKLRPEVKQQLEAIADDFLQEMGIHELDVRDITISGSNAAYSYTDHSDLDLHILVNVNDLPRSEVYKELFQAKKTIYNDTHDITIHKVPVELYVQDANEPVISLGEYSIKNDSWIKIPTKRRSNFDQTATRAKYEKLLDIINHAIKSNELQSIQKVLKKIKQYRQAGLDKGGEFGPENLAYKALRSQGYITKLYDLRDKLHSQHLTIENMYQDPVKIQRDTLEEKLSKEFEDYSPDNPPGPEFPPTMPAGTVKVDVSDTYDWYKLGQHISNMKGLGKHDFGKGPPSTILSFGDEDTEHKYIKDLEKTGLTTTDIDPVDPKQPKGMKRQKTDPTYNVSEQGTMQYAAEKTPPTNPYGGLRDTQYRGSISEAPVIGNYADLYHTAWTDTGTLDSILQSGKLIPGQNKWLSLTRDSRLDYAKMMGQFAEFVIDQNKLRQRVKLDQYDDFKGRGSDEAEERVNVPIPLKGYVKSIHLPASWKHDEKAMQYYEPKLKQYGIPFYYDTMGSPEDRNADVPRLEESSGYIPSEKEKNDPRFKTALTVDVKPDSIKKNAKSFYWNTSRAGIPPTANPNGKV